MDARAVLATLTLLLVLGGFAWAPGQQERAASGVFPVFVVDATALWLGGNVTLAHGDAFGALLALTEAHGIAVAWDDRPGCTYDYVHGIGELQETNSGGWNFYLDRDGSWAWQPAAATCTSLHPGDRVLWCWVEADGPCAVWP